MKKIITVAIIVLVFVGLGFWLFSISPAERPSASAYQLDTSQATKISEPPAFDPAVDRYIGNPAAKNVFIAYEDYQCPACATYSDILNQVPTEFTDTVFVYRYFPLYQIHANAIISSLAAEAAGAQGKYWEMHDLLFAKQSEWENLTDPIDAFASYAGEAGVANIEQFKNDIISQKFKSRIERDNNQAVGLSLQGTPTFFFNGHPLQNQELAGLKSQAEAFYNK